jgi:dihydrolipoamide dehydrogenase
MTTYDIAILGGGPGGYSCALRAAKLGLSTALIDDRACLGDASRTGASAD